MSFKNLRKLSAAFAVGVTLLSLGGCASSAADASGFPLATADPTDEPPTSTAQMSSEQVESLEDGLVTEDEYKKAFDAYSSCMTEGGYPLLLGKAGESKIIDFSVEAEAVDSGVEGDCYAEHFKEVDIGWQLSQEGK